MYVEHSAVMMMILSRLSYERFSILGSVVFDFFFFWEEFQVFYFCICLFLMNSPLAYESRINTHYAEYSTFVSAPGTYLAEKNCIVGL